MCPGIPCWFPAIVATAEVMVLATIFHPMLFVAPWWRLRFVTHTCILWWQFTHHASTFRAIPRWLRRYWTKTQIRMLERGQDRVAVTGGDVDPILSRITWGRQPFFLLAAKKALWENVCPCWLVDVIVTREDRLLQFFLLSIFSKSSSRIQSLAEQLETYSNRSTIV